MVYEYRLPGMLPVPAQDAGEELNRIYDKYGRMDAPDVVEESRPEEATLHPCFEWDDQTAAEKYREQQARCIINCVVTVVDTKQKEPVTVRAFHHVDDTYTPVQVVLKSKDKTQEMVDNAVRELLAFRKKNEIIAKVAKLAPVFAEIDKL